MSKYIAIDLTPGSIFVVAGSARSGHAKIEQALSWTEADGEAPPPLTGDTAKRIGETLRDKLKAAGIANAPVLVSVGRGRVILKELRYPVVPDAEEPAIVKFQAMKELSDTADDMVLDYSPLSNGAAEDERRSMAVVIRKELFAAIQQMCAAANLKLVAVTPRPYAIAAGLTRAFATGAVPPPESRIEAVAALLLGPAGGEFTVARGGEVIFTRDVPGPVATSEPMLLGEVRRNLTMYAGSAPGHPVQGLYVAEASGGWAGRLLRGARLAGPCVRSTQWQRSGGGRAASRTLCRCGRSPGGEGRWGIPHQLCRAAAAGGLQGPQAETTPRGRAGGHALSDLFRRLWLPGPELGG